MERTDSLLSMSSTSSTASRSRFGEPLLPYTEKPSQNHSSSIKAVFGHCMYKRVIVWTVASFSLIALFMYNGRPDRSLNPAYGQEDLVIIPQQTPSQFPPQMDLQMPPQFPSEVSPQIVPDPAPHIEPVIEHKIEAVPQTGADKGNAVAPGTVPQKAPNAAAGEGLPASIFNADDNARMDSSSPIILAPVDDGVQKPAIGFTPDQLNQEEDLEERRKFEMEANAKPWLRFLHLDGFYHGLKTLVKAADLLPEYPSRPPSQALPFVATEFHQVPKPVPYNPYGKRDSGSGAAKTCYLDRDNKIAPPDIYAYNGIPQQMPDPVLGSYELFGIRDDVCFDRFGRYGPYGLGYSAGEGGSGVGEDTESSENGEVWAKSGKINYDAVDWGLAQDRCVQINKHRLLEADAVTGDLPRGHERNGKKGRQAVVMRCYTDFKWTQLAVVNFRALITEVSLKTGGEYQVHLLLHVRDNDEPIWADTMVVRRILDTYIPPEFHGLVSLWSEAQMKLLYPGDYPDEYDNPSGQPIHSVYRSAHFPLQIFASQHPEYEHFWNWEMDMRLSGNYFEFFDRLGQWADQQPRPMMWERSERYYIPSYHGSWENFTAKVQNDHAQSGNPPIFGPIDYPYKKLLRSEEIGQSVLPDSCMEGHDPTQCGVGEGADLITLNPIFDIAQSGWVFSNDMTGYPGATDEMPPRRSSIITAGRLSKRLLMSMHEEVWRHHRSMFTEMFPATVALHHGLKAIFAPHPISFERAWLPEGSSIDTAFNSGRDHSTSSWNSPFYLGNEHYHKGATFYYHSEFAGRLWRRWLGYAQMDGRGLSSSKDSGFLRGGMLEESQPGSSGRMCLRSMLFHPIKHEHPEE